MKNIVATILVITTMMVGAPALAQDATAQGGIAPGMDLNLDGIPFPIDLQGLVHTPITPEWTPRITWASNSGRLRKGETATFTFADCPEHIGQTNWFIVNAMGGDSPLYISQNGGCSMQVRFRSSGQHRISIGYTYKYRTEGGSLRSTSTVRSAPLTVEVQSDFNWMKRVITPVVSAYVLHRIADNNREGWDIGDNVVYGVPALVALAPTIGYTIGW